MASVMETCFLVMVVATLFLILILFLRRCRKVKVLNLPPGPKPWPLIGNLNLIGPLPHCSIHQLSQKYGPIMQLQIGSFPFVVGSSVEMAKLFLKTHDLTFASRPKTAAGKYLGYNYSDILWSSYDHPYWRQARKICLMELFSAKRLESFEHIRKEEIYGMLKDLFESAGNPTILRHHLLTMSLNVISRMILGRNLKYFDDNSSESDNNNAIIASPDEFKKLLSEFFFLSGMVNIGDVIPWIDFLDLQGYVKRMKALIKKFDRFLEHVLDEHNQRRNGIKDYVPEDMVDVLLQVAEDPNFDELEVKLERHGVKAITLDLIAAGTESSGVTIEWAMSELLKNPEILNKATEELDRVIGRERWVEENDITKLPYIDAIMKESMRLHPVAPLLVPRICREDCEIAGYDIPKGTRVLINVWTIGREPALWENPTVFNPERFIGKNIDVKGQNFELIPFGSGRRICPGYNLGLKVVQASLANLLHGFSWELPESMKNEDLNMEEVFGLSTPRKLPLIAVAKPRLPLHLYCN